MAKKYMFCPIHTTKCMETTQTVKNLYSAEHEPVPVFHCQECHRYYFNSNGKREGTLNTGKTAATTGEKIFTTDSKVFDEKPSTVPKAAPKTNTAFKKLMEDSIFGKPAQSNLHGVTSHQKSSSIHATNEVRIHMFKKGEADAKLMASLAHLLVEYPPLGTFHDINEFVKKIFPSNISQKCVVRNASFLGMNGHVVKRVEIYNQNSSFLKMRLPENTYIAFAGRLSGGELIIDEMRVIQSPVLKKDDSEETYVFLYDGPNHPNALWDKAIGAAEHPEELKGELADWSAYLDWKRQLAEMRIEGIKYIGVRFNVEERQMSILAVTEGEETFKRFRKALRRNEVSAFSNVYSSDQWMFYFNHDEMAYKNETGVELVFVGEGEHYTRDSIDRSWDREREYFKKYTGQEENPDISFLLGGISRNYFEPYYVELIFELSNSAFELIDRNIRRTGNLPDNLEQILAAEFYGDGYLATSQIGDFALLRRLKNAVFDLAKGKAASQGLDRWLFDISKARLPESLEEITYWQNPDINERQKLAVEKILSTPDVCLIQGPPGTGKTTVIAEAIYQAVIRNKRVLVSSQANLAVDNALERLISNPKIRAIRLGSSRKIDSSVNNITEEHVLESFYESMVDYLDRKYLHIWRDADAIIEACDNDYARVEALETELYGLERQALAKASELETAKRECSSEQSFMKQSALKMERASLAMLKAYINNGIEDLELALGKESVNVLWKEIYPAIMKLQEHGIWLTRVGINEEQLNDISGIGKANDILKHVIVNVRRINKLGDKLDSEVEFGGDSEELELLRIKEQELKEKVLRDMNPDDMTEWKAINEQIAKFSASGASVSDSEKVLFGQDISEREQIISNRDSMRNIIRESEEILSTLGVMILQKTGELIQIINKQQEQMEIENADQENRIKTLEDEKLLIEARQLADKEAIQRILQKYNADRENFEEQIASRKEEVDDDAGIDRDEWEEIFKKFTDWVEDIPDYAQEKDLFLKTFINGCNVVGVSCTENARTLNEAGFDDFDLVIIDEVSKATPPELLIPMLRGRKIVLVGDHRQLPPLFNEHEKTYQEVAQQQEELIKANDDNVIVELTMADFEKYKSMVTASLFQQYFEHGKADIKETLIYQYRMHKDIMDIVNLFYDGYLKDGNEGKYEDGRKSHDLFIHSTSGTAMIIPDRHAYWFDSSTLDGVEIYEQRKAGSTSAENIFEAYTIIEMLKKMEVEYANQRSGKSPVSVGVISFYYDQVSTLRTMVKNESFHAIDVEINTVDRFQGKEKEIIIVSLVRNVKNARHNTDSHIAAFQRINVAFSRAQNLLIIVGAKDMYAPQPVVLTDMNNGEEKTVMVYKNIIEMMDMKGTLYSCEDVIPDNVTETIFEKLSKKGDLEA